MPFWERRALRIIKESYGIGPRLPIVVPIMNAGDHITKRLREHLVNALGEPFELILVESRGDEFSYGRSINAGLKEAFTDHDIAVGMDSDAFPQKGVVKEVLQLMKEHPILGYVGARVASPDGKEVIGMRYQNLPSYLKNSLSAGAPLTAVRRLLKGRWYTFSSENSGSYDEGRMVGFPTTFFALRRDCFQEVGGFDPTFRYSFVDTDFAFRVLVSRWRIGVSERAIVRHDEHSSASKELRRREFDNWDRFLEKWSKDRIKEVKEAAHDGRFMLL